MNINRDVTNRALTKIGNDPLLEGDSTSSVYLLVSLFYLQTYLEALAEVPWTCAKKRQALVLLPEATPNLSSYGFMYAMPIDCSRPLEILEEQYYIVEGSTLYTNKEDAELLYISNGKLDEEDQDLEDDYPEYGEQPMEPLFWQYFELRLGAKLAQKISGKEELYRMLYTEATIIADKATIASISSGYAKKNGNDWWPTGGET